MGETLSAQQARAYLERIGLDGGMLDQEPSLELLDRLVFAHVCTVPFDSRWVCTFKRAPSLALDDLFRKIVVERGGGYCFELNKLFEKLLLALGFKARPCLARAVCGRTEPVPIDHRAELVLLDGVWHYADVGFGGPACARAVPLVDGAHISDDLHDFELARVDETWWRLERVVGVGALRCEMEVCTATAYDRDFESLNVAQSLPGTEFAEVAFYNLRTERGSIAIKDLGCKVRSSAGLDERTFASAAERDVFIANLG